jgi:hypothetical protein
VARAEATGLAHSVQGLREKRSMAPFVSVQGFSQGPGLFEKRFPAFFGLHRIEKRSSRPLKK